jgi:small-conductance mechanosensitive channel
MLHWLDQLWDGDLVGVLVKHGIRILIILIVAGILRAIVDKMINRTVRRMVAKAGHQRTRASKIVAKTAVFSDARREQRIGALGSLGRSAVLIILLAIVSLMILTELGFNIAALLAGTSIIGIAVAFGVQTILRDIISGIFILLEDQLGLGDYVRVGDIDGVVEEVGLRLTHIRDGDGTIWYLRNGDIAKVGNYSQGSGTGRPPQPEPEMSEPDGVSSPPGSEQSS